MSEGPVRLTPIKSSRKLQLLGFIKRYFFEDGKAPSHGEMSAYLGVSGQRVRAILNQLEQDGEIVQQRGVRRGVRLRSMLEELSTVDALLLLKQRGFKIDAGMPLAVAFPLANLTLPIPPALDYLPDVECGDGDGKINGRRRRRGRGVRRRAPASS